MKIKIDTVKLSNQLDAFNDVQKKLISISDKLDVLSNKNDWDDIYDGIAENIKGDIFSCSQNLQTCASKTTSYCRFIQNTINQYDTCENELNDKALGKDNNVYAFNGTQVQGIGSSNVGITTIGNVGVSAIQQGANEENKESEKKDELKYLSLHLFGKEIKIPIGTIAKGAVVSSGAVGAGIFTFKGSVLGGNIKSELESEMNFKEGEFGSTGKVAAKGYVAEGEIGCSGWAGEAKLKGSVGNVGASGELGATLYKNDKFAPSVGIEGKASASVAKGSFDAHLGNDDYNVHGEAKGDFLSAEAKAGFKAGVIEYEDSTGNTLTKLGIDGKVGAEAYLAKGSLKGGVTLMGIDIDLEIEGKAGGAGAKAGAAVSTTSVSGEIGAGLLLGAGLKVNVDWSDFLK